MHDELALSCTLTNIIAGRYYQCYSAQHPLIEVGLIDHRPYFSTEVPKQCRQYRVYLHITCSECLRECKHNARGIVRTISPAFIPDLARTA